MFKRVLLLAVLVAVLVVPGSAFDYTQTFTGPFTWSESSGSDWNGPTWTFDLDYPVTDYEITWNIDLSGNSIGSNTAHGLIRGHDLDGHNILWARGGDLSTVQAEAVFEAYSGSAHIGTAGSAYASKYNGPVSVTRSGATHELWVGSNRAGNGASGSDAPLKRITLNVARLNANPIVPGFSVGSVTVHGNVFEPPCNINVYDADTRMPLSGEWNYSVVIQGEDTVSGSGSGAFTVVNLPVTSIFQPHLVYVTKEGYEMTPAVVAVDVPDEGREIKIYMKPMETVVQPGYRSGTVTMTDNNGTTITGFEVTAVNAYTDQSYTVSTDTDVAVMTLPMERTITIRNPQTGEYEKAPIGYYRFYGQASGYKMLNEEGIQVAVMPEKYGSYQLCDIGVTSESGYLTGNHQFQIRSRSDNSILQTGTVSAKSATTGNWYNTTVSGGIATLILPYDTSNAISQYAGNYYVYATSPGYEDSDYGTQIVVMPHTVSETRIILLTPAGGIPTPGNVTLRIQAFSETGPGVVNAEIFISGVQGAGASVWDTYTASSTGYLTVSVPGNSTYDIVASGAGFYDSARRVTVYDDDPGLIEIKLYLSGAPTVEPTTQPTGWPTTQPTTQPTGGIPDEDDDSEGFLMQAVRGIGLAFGVGFATAKLIFGMLLALSIGYTTAKQLRGGAAEFGLGLLGGTLLGVLIGLLPVWIIVVLLLVVGLYIGNRYVGGGSNNG